MADMRGSLGFLGAALSAGFHPFFPDFEKVESIYLSRDKTTLMVNTNYCTTFFKGLEKVEIKKED